MKTYAVVFAAMAFGVAALAAGPSGNVSIGAAAPSFDVKDSNGKTVNLEDFKGKYVVLEWSNFGCPYVRKHYNSGNMQALQKKYTQKGVVWLTIFSSTEGNQGYYPPDRLNKFAEQKKMSSRLIPDPEASLAKEYGAKCTPTMFIIDPNGKIAYMGGIDDKNTADIEDIATAKNYVSAALDEALAGKEIAVTTSRPYGCGIKY